MGFPVAVEMLPKDVLHLKHKARTGRRG
jgi:hypothetical protein